MSNTLPSKLMQRLKDEFLFEEKSYFEGQSNTALIIIDIQNDFLPGGSLAVPDGDEIIPIINKLQKHFDLIVITQDWHPVNHKSFASSHKNKEPYEIIKWQRSSPLANPLCAEFRGCFNFSQLGNKKSQLNYTERNESGN